MSAEKVGPTPGPWVVNKGGRNHFDDFGHWGTIRGGAKNFNLVTVWADTSELEKCAEANAHLIASAPDLLAIAKRYARECTECGGHGVVRLVDFEGTPIDDKPCHACSDIRATIAKAEGGA